MPLLTWSIPSPTVFQVYRVYRQMTPEQFSELDDRRIVEDEVVAAEGVVDVVAVEEEEMLKCPEHRRHHRGRGDAQTDNLIPVS